MPSDNALDDGDDGDVGDNDDYDDDDDCTIIIITYVYL